LKKEISGKIAEQCLEQISISHNYNIRFAQENSTEEVPVYEAKSILAKDETHFRTIRVDQGKYICDCESYWRNGLICRHIFALTIINQDKELEKIHIHMRWRCPGLIDLSYDLKENNMAFETPKVSEYLRKYGKVSKANQKQNKEDQKENNEEAKEGDNEKAEEENQGRRVKVNTKARGAPKKTQRAKSCTEKSTRKSKIFSPFLMFERKYSQEQRS